MGTSVIPGIGSGCCPRLRRSFGGPVGGRRLAGEAKLDRFAAEQSKNCRLYLDIGKLFLAAMGLQRCRVVGRFFVAALMHTSTVVSPFSPTAWVAVDRRVAACLARCISKLCIDRDAPLGSQSHHTNFSQE